MIDPREYAERHTKGRSRETRKQRVASTEVLIRAVLADALRWAEGRCDAEIKAMRMKTERG